MTINIKKEGHNKGKLRTYPKKDLTGQKINKLTVIKFLRYDVYKKYKSSTIRHPIWLCACECGKECEIAQHQLTCVKKQISCGCALKDVYATAGDGRRLVLPPGEASFNKKYGEYEWRATRKLKIPFLLSKEQFKKITQQNCFYCGRSPSVACKTPQDKRLNQTGYLSNGIDRIAGKDGYTIKNVVACCEICNKAKRDLSYDEFLSWLNDLCGHIMKTNFYKEII
jgi:hypothetical protein